MEAAEEAPSFTLQSAHYVVTGNADKVQDLQQTSDDRVMDTLSVDNNKGATAELQADKPTKNLPLPNLQGASLGVRASDPLFDIVK